MKKAFSIRESLSGSWKLIKNEYLFLIDGVFIVYILALFLQSLFIKGGLGSLIQITLGVIFALGMTKITLQIADGEEPGLESFTGQMSKFFKMVGANILVSLPMIVPVVLFVIGFLPKYITLPGIANNPDYKDLAKLAEVPVIMNNTNLFLIAGLLLFIPAFYLSVRWMFYPYLIVDKGLGTIESMKKSMELTRGHVGHLLLLILSTIAIVILGFAAFLIGLFVSIPLIYMMQTLIYRKLEKANSKADAGFEEITLS